MATSETTEFKLQSTPTGGVDASHSPYYRRLLSAGYKGYLQGTIGGASLYGTFGLVIGGLVAIPLLATPIGWGALALIPAAAGIGIVKGASTFGQIGSTAATLAESADLSEQRRYLLDRYYDLPEGPEGDREAQAIKRELAREREGNEVPPPFFHWKTVAVCALMGAGLMLGFGALAPTVLAEAGIIHSISAIVGHSAAASMVGALAGALTGAVIGIDRYYIRKWFDTTEGVVHSSSHKQSALIERSLQVARLKEAALADAKTKKQLGLADEGELTPPLAAAAPTAQPEKLPTDAKPIASLSAAHGTNETPDTKVSASDAVLKQRLAAIQHAMDIPAL